jgi:hypothetical protein
MQLNAKNVCLSHNQVVPGSSPGGTTGKPFKFILKGFFYYLVKPRRAKNRIFRQANMFLTE